MRSFAFPCLFLKNTTWLWTTNTSSMFSVAWIEVMPLRTAFALCRGSCCAVANNLEVSFQAFRDFIYTAVVREKKFVIISYKCNGHFQTVFVWRGRGGGWWGGKKVVGKERERGMLFMRFVLLASLWLSQGLGHCCVEHMIVMAHDSGNLSRRPMFTHHFCALRWFWDSVQLRTYQCTFLACMFCFPNVGHVIII